MSEYGKLREVQRVLRSTSLTSAASISDTELEVDSAGDFDEEFGGVLRLNGVDLAYTGVVNGTLENDSDFIQLAEPLTAAADEDDEVVPVVGGQVVEDWYAMVDMGGGPPVAVPLTLVQRTVMAEGPYEPTPVVVSEDLQRVEDLPGRPPTASARVAFWNTDAVTVTEPGDVSLTLTHTPLAGSLHVRWGTLMVPAEFWTLTGRVLTILDPDLLMLAGDEISTAYAYDPATSALDVVDPEPVGGVIVDFEASGWKYLQIARTDPTDYSASAFDDSGWATGTAAFGEWNGPWSGVIPAPPAPTTPWDVVTRLWLRRTVAANTALDLLIDVRVEDEALVYLNGSVVGSIPANNSGATVRITVDSADVLASNVLAIRATDDTFTAPDGDSYLDVAVSQ